MCFRRTLRFRFTEAMTTMKDGSSITVVERGDGMGKIIAIANQKGGVGVRP